MTLVCLLALQDLVRERLHFICNAAMIVGVLVPLLVVYGLKAGVYGALVDDLRSNPATLRIDTVANTAFSARDAETVRAWPETAFAVLRSRSFADYVNVRRAGSGPIREAIAVPTGPGDPLLPRNVALSEGQAAPSALLAEQLGLSAGDRIDVVTSAATRSRQLRLDIVVGEVLPRATISGRSIMLDANLIDLIEAFYDGYALPELGVPDGRPLAERVPEFEGLRVHATDISTVCDLQGRIEAKFSVRTESRCAEISFWAGLQRKLDIAMTLLALAGAAGLVAALVFSFWAEVARKRQMLATLSLLGIKSRHVALFPVVQALATGAAGIAAAFAILGIAALVVNRSFGGVVPGDSALLAIEPGHACVIALGSLLIITMAATHAALAARRLDPASILREGH